MFRVLTKSLQIEATYTINSFIYFLRKYKIFRDIFRDNIYADKTFKKIIVVIGNIYFIIRSLFLKFMYYFVILIICYKFFKNDIVFAFFHIYFVLTILGMFINNQLLTTNKQRYFSICLFNVDGTKYFRSLLFWRLLNIIILNGSCIFFFTYYLMSPPNLLYSSMLLVFTVCIRLIGEALNIMFYKKYKYIWYSNTKLYFPIVIGLFGICLLPFIDIFVPISYMFIITYISILLGILSLIYLLRIKDYRLMYKRLTLVTNVMNSKNEKDYLSQAMVDIQDRDKVINKELINNKHGYDFFNTIFFERHKEILLRSSRKWAGIAFVIYGIVIYLVLSYDKYFNSVSNVLNNHLTYFIVIMLFINRGPIVTQAMFYNCDYAMLRYNFYREEDTILSLFKKRLVTIIKVNLIPSIVVGIGNVVLLILTNNSNILVLITNFIFIQLLSILFSVFYLVIYYLLQPFDKNMQVKKVSYSFVNMIVYGLVFFIVGYVIKPLILSIVGIIVCILFIISSLLLVKRYAPKTFKLN